MSYFSFFGNTKYAFGRNVFEIKNLLNRSSFISEYKPYSDLYETYIISDHETLQSIAEGYYGSVNFYWVISIFNELHDLKGEFPMTQYVLEKYVDKTYGLDADKIKFYENIQTELPVGEIKEYYSGFVSPENPNPESEFIVGVSFREYENRANEEKRFIKLLRKELLNEFILQFRNSLINVN